MRRLAFLAQIKNGGDGLTLNTVAISKVIVLISSVHVNESNTENLYFQQIQSF